jgi:hypothetical protein
MVLDSCWVRLDVAVAESALSKEKHQRKANFSRSTIREFSDSRAHLTPTLLSAHKNVRLFAACMLAETATP